MLQRLFIIMVIILVDELSLVWDKARARLVWQGYLVIPIRIYYMIFYPLSWFMINMIMFITASRYFVTSSNYMLLVSTQLSLILKRNKKYVFHNTPSYNFKELIRTVHLFMFTCFYQSFIIFTSNYSYN